MNIPPFPSMNNTVKRDFTEEMLKFPSDHSLDDKTASVVANFRATTSNFHHVSSHNQSFLKRVANITSNSLHAHGFAVIQLMNGKFSIASIIKMGLEAALTF